MTVLDRIAIAIAGILGATGVAAAAASSHAGAALLGPYSLIALTHAPALLALALAPLPRLFKAALAVIALGATVFCIDLGVRYLFGSPPVRMLAPIGGVSLVAGWLLVSIAVLSGIRR